jgi:hypothetical protein
VPVAIGDGASPNVGGPAGLLAGQNNDIAWRPALRAALMVAVPAAVLCSGLTPIGPSLGLFWMSGAAAWAVGLYFKRSRPGWMSLGAGARIGLVTGLFASWLTLGVNGVALWVTRYVLNQGGQMDSLWASEVQNSLQVSQQMVAQMGMTAAQAAESTQFNKAWMLSAEGRAGIALSTFLGGGVFLICFAMIGGALGARLLAQPRRPSV